jgi:hypothetical protein
VQELGEERSSDLFQFLLRDLQVEGVPLLSVDADQVHTLQAALWTTMAELYDNRSKEDQKVCLIFEEIPVSALRSFVDDFMILKTQERLIESLPELSGFSLSLVGKGVGPAILVELAAASEDAEEEDSLEAEIANTTQLSSEDQLKATAAMKSFVDRLIVTENVCPYTASTDVAPAGLEDKGIPPSALAYRGCGFSDVCHVLSSFWNCVCEILATPSNELSATILAMPTVGQQGMGKEKDHARFTSVSELLSRTLCLYRGDSVLELLYFYPAYDRDLVHPADKPAHGHLPPTSWLRPMLRWAGKEKEADSLSDSDLALSNYQRRSPVTAVCIKRVAMLDEAATGDSGIVDLDLGDDGVMVASGVPTYAQNAVRLAELGEEALRSQLDDEIAIATSR